MKIGYARISTDDQRLNLQRDALQAAGCERVFTDTASGSRADRQGLADALDFARAGDVVVVWRLDRLGRSLKELVTLVERLKAAGVGLESLMEKIDTTTASGELVFHVFGAIAQFERRLIVERTKAGLVAARARGRSGGRRPLSQETIESLNALVRAGRSPAEVCRALKIGRTTFYKYSPDHSEGTDAAPGVGNVG